MGDPIYSAEDLKAAEAAAGIPPEKIDAVTESLNKQGRAVKEVTKDTTGYNAVQTDSFDILTKINTFLGDTGTKLENVGNLTGAAATAFGVFTSALISTNKELENFSGIDTSRLGNFTDDATDLLKVVSKLPGVIDITSGAAGKLAGMLSMAGASGKDIVEAAKAGGGAFAQMGQNLLMNVDNVVRWESGFTQAMQQAGDSADMFEPQVGKAFKGVGEHFEHLNEQAQQLNGVVGNVMQATFTKNKEVVEKLALSLGQIPGGMESMVKGIDIASTHFDTLTAVMQLATGAGLDQTQTMQDIKKATEQTGMGIEDAVKYMGNLAGVSTRLHGQIGDVRAAMLEVTGAFKLYSTGGEQAAKMNQGLSDSIENYAWSLHQSGLPIENAIELAKKQVLGMKDLGIAQEALISQTTGGKGGVQGALEFDLLKRTDPAKAAKQVQDSMKQLMGGSIISEEQAVKTGRGDQYIKEQMLLKSGIGGMKAGSDDEAYAMINQIIAGKMPTNTVDKDQAMKDVMSKGEKAEQLTATGFRQANIDVQTATLTAGTLALGGLQDAFAATSGTTAETGRGINVPMQEQLRSVQGAGEHPNVGTPIMDLEKRTKGVLDTLIIAGQTVAQSAMENVTNKTGPTKAQEQASIAAQISARKQVAGMTGGGSFAGFGQAYNPAGKQVGQAIPRDSRSHITPGHEPVTGVAGGAASKPVPVTLVGGSGLTVNFTGKCPHCNWDINSNEHATVNSPASQKPR